MRQENILCFSLLFVILATSVFIVISYKETFTGLVGANVSFTVVSLSTSSETSSGSSSSSSGSSSGSISRGGGTGSSDDNVEEEEEDDGEYYLAPSVEPEKTLYFDGLSEIIGETFTDFKVGDVLYFGSEENFEEVPFLKVSSFDESNNLVTFTLSDVSGDREYTVDPNADLFLDLDHDGLDDYVLVLEGAENGKVNFSVRKVAQISFALLGAPVVVPVVLNLWLIIIGIILFLVVLFLIFLGISKRNIFK